VLSALSARTGYGPAKDFAPVAKFHGGLPDSSRPFVVTVDLGERSHRRPARPSKALNWAHSDTAGLPQLAGELFMTRAGIRIVGVPYRSGGESVTAVLSQAEAEARLKISLM
jgi:tripartite-type tricarboxylate transporter receptor subunit TctC